MRTAQFMRVVSFDIVYPPHQVVAKLKTAYNATNIISYFEIKDNYLDGYGGHVLVKSGGVGYSTVGFHFHSKRNHGFEFNIYIYTRSKKMFV